MLDAKEGQDALTEHNHYSRLGMCRSDQPGPGTNNGNTDTIVPHQFPSPYDAHGMSNSIGIPCWTPNEYLTRKVPLMITTLFPR